MDATADETTTLPPERGLMVWRCFAWLLAYVVGTLLMAGGNIAIHSYLARSGPIPLTNGSLILFNGIEGIKYAVVFLVLGWPTVAALVAMRREKPVPRGFEVR